MNKQEAADLLGVSTRQIENYAKAGQLTVTYAKNEYGNRTATFDLAQVEAIKKEIEAKYRVRQEKKKPKVLGPNDANAPGGELVTTGAARPELLTQFIAALETSQQRPALSVADKLLLTLEEAQQLTGLSRERLREAIKAGALQARQIGRAWRIKRAALETYIQEL